ncbi:MAG: 3-deoxy-manno-octulosonate cytidylyltransferase [Wenzhouxiangellaceae bacterium]|nr:3-deoxy-manno-octulosonate cytidylyltransferase [Wenzhouxiangellaceae bacterium]
MNRFHVLIPARLASTRLPQKALADLAGKPLIVRVWERACAAGAESVHVATDSDRIADVVHAAGGRVVMTASGHDSGTSRLSQAAGKLGLDEDEIVLNVQGDEPAVPVACLRQLAGLLAARRAAHMATLWSDLADEAQWLDPNVVKLVTRADGTALYFSRAPIPARRAGDWPAGLARRHLGLYAYRAAALADWPGLAESPLEASEALEQLRALQAGWEIVCQRAVESIPPGVDTAEDLEAMRRHFAALSSTSPAIESEGEA